MSLLSVTNANKTYAGTSVLKNARLELASAEVHALMGENGAGKSTLIKILAGVVVADSVEIKVKGKAVIVRTASDAFAAGFRFIHQELNIVPQVSVAENLFLGHAYPRRLGVLVNWASLNKKASQALARLGITHIHPKEQMAKLSTGDKMLVKIAAALLADETQEASVYVMDEPTAALSGEESQRLFKVIDELKKQGAAILYVSHRMDEVLELSDRVTVMRDGETIATRMRQETSKQDLIQLMTGRSMTEAYPKRESPFAKTVNLEVNQLSTRHIKDVSFKLHKGEILGLAGLADAGQSDVLRALIAADKPNQGTIKLQGQKSAKGINQVWQQGFAFVPPERRTEGLVLSRSIRDNTTLAKLAELSLGGVILNPSKETSLTENRGKDVKLKATSIKQASFQLSGGNQQKVVFARALASSPKVLLLDEPTRGVDVGAKFDIYTLIRDLSRQGVSVLMASSDLTELLGMCDRILIMKDKKMLDIVTTDDLTQEQLLSLCYGDTLSSHKHIQA